MPIAEAVMTETVKALAGSSVKYAFTTLMAKIAGIRGAPPDALLCRKYLDVAKDALRALEREVDEILIDAEFCDTADDDEVRQLCKRIKTYIYVSKMIFVLRDAVDGIETCQKALAQNQDAFFAKLPLLRDDRRKEAVAALDATLPELRTCIEKLMSGELRCVPAGTGLLIEQLDQIGKAAMAHAPRDKIDELVANARQLKATPGQAQGFDVTCSAIDKIDRTIALAFPGSRMPLPGA